MGFMDGFLRKKTSGNTAKDRLKLVLVSDRANCSPETMELIKNDIIKVISKYMEIDTDGLDIQITQMESDGGHGMFRQFMLIFRLRSCGLQGSEYRRTNMLKQKYQFKNYNWVLIGAVLILSGMGVLFINSADSSYTSKQLVGLIFCTGVMLFLSVVNFNFVCGFNRVLYMINIVLLVLVKLVGVSVNGAQRWINLGFTRLQPSELTKIIMIIFVAVYIQEHEEDLMEWKVLLKLALLCALPLFLVVIEPNLSTTLDITFILLSVIFVGGFSMALIKKWLKIIIPVMIPLGFLFIWYIQTPNQILLHDYQVTRIMTFLEPSKYSSTSAYQQDNSVMAIGSGKLYGKGLNNNTIADVTVADTGFVSEQQTDFIFSVVGEETGFVGSVIVIALLAIIVIECLKTAYVAKNMSGRLIASGMAALIGFQSFINIGVATEFLPNTGLPLPFVSYGLTSLLSYMAGIGIVLNIGLQRHY